MLVIHIFDEYADGVCVFIHMSFPFLQEKKSLKTSRLAVDRNKPVKSEFGQARILTLDFFFKIGMT